MRKNNNSTALVDTLSNEKKLELALQEYYFIEEAIDKFDARSLSIKSWSVTSSAVAISLAYAQDTPFLLLVGSTSAIIFWYVEATWKFFQDALTPRIIHLEKVIKDDISRYRGPSINKAFRNQFTLKRELARFPRIFTYRNVHIPHSLIALIGFFLYFYFQ